MQQPFRICSELPVCVGNCWPVDRKAEEILAKQPGRTGDFWWVKVEKTSLGTKQAREAIARSVACEPDLVACAGFRDRQGVSIQWFSVPVSAVDHPGPLRRAGAHGKMRVLEITNSHKAIGPETVASMRWTCRIRGGNSNDGYQKGKAILNRLRNIGCPNWMPSAQVDSDLVRLGRILLEGKRLPAQAAARHIDAARCRRATQGWLFDRWLEARCRDGLLDRCVMGDRIVSLSGEQSLVTDPAATQRRLDSWEAVVLGPVFGDGLSGVTGEALERERALLADKGISIAQCQHLEGSRRRVRVQPTKAMIDIDGRDLLLMCELPPEAAIDVVLLELLAQSEDPVVKDKESE